MEPRLIIAYAIIALLVLGAAALLAYTRYNTRDRKIARRRVREEDAFQKRHDQT